MASITATQAAGFSVGAIPGRLSLDKRPTDQFFEVLPFVPIQGHEILLNAVDASTLGLSALADAEGAGQAIVTTMPAIATRNYPLKRISAEMPIDSLLPGIYGSHRDLLQIMLNLKVDAVRDHCKLLLVRGDKDAVAEEFDGLAALANEYGQELGANGSGANGGTALPGEVQDLVGMLNPRPSSENCYLVMHAKAYKHLVKLNYSDVEYVKHELLGTLPSIIGVPVLIDNYIPLDETKGSSTDCTSIYAVMIGDGSGLCGIYPAAHEGQEIQVRGPVPKEGTDTMWYHVSWDVGLACFNKGAVARLNGVRHAL